MLAGACGFQAVPSGGVATEVDGGPGSQESIGDDVVHVGPADEYTGTADLTIDQPITIDTGAMTFGMALPAGATFAAATQDGGGPELAVLHVRGLAVHANVRAFGARPLVVLADSFELTRMIDVSAHDQVGGPGAQSAPISGGGQVLIGGAPGEPPIATVLCDVAPPGGGGGALELYARTRISISGIIDAGGGMPGATSCTGIVIAPSPFGSGGTIVLQAPVVENSGRLTANDGRAAAGAPGGGGQILMLYKTKIAAGVTSPVAHTQQY